MMNTLRLWKMQYTFRFTSPAHLPPFIGNTLRGALGRALGIDSPAYGYVFKTKAEASVPNPFVISAPYPSKELYGRGDTLSFFITLLGNAANYAADITAAVQEMCHGKLENCVCEAVELLYDRVWSDAGAESIPHCDALTVNFVTPAEILSGKEPVKELEFSMFIDSLFGRISGVIDHYTDGQFVIPYTLMANKPRVQAAFDVKEIKLQTNQQPISGFTGTVKYYGNVTRYLPYIDLGSQLHIGKKTTRACGEYRFEIEKN